MGAIRKAIPACSLPSLVAATEEQFNKWICAHDDTVSSIPDWNDSRERTKEEIILYMSKFADEFDPQVH